MKTRKSEGRRRRPTRGRGWWRALRSKEVQAIFNRLDRMETKNRVEALWDEIHNATSYTLQQEYAKSTGDPADELGIHHPMVAKLQADRLFELYESVFEVWSQIHQRYAEVGRKRLLRGGRLLY